MSKQRASTGYEDVTAASDRANKHSLLNATDAEDEQRSDPTKSAPSSIAPVASTSSAQTVTATPAARTGIAKTKRQASPSVKMIARIERQLEDMDPASYNRVLTWLKGMPLREIV